MRKFFIELIKRFFSKNPKFFKYIQIAAAAVLGISLTITTMQKEGIELSPFLSWLDSALIQASSILTAVIAQLPNQDPNAGK